MSVELTDQTAANLLLHPQEGAMHKTTFSTVKVPFTTGIEIGVSITSPSSATEDVAAWLEEISAAVGQLDSVILHEIVERADARGLMTLKGAGERALTLTSTIRRELAISQGVLDALTAILPDSVEPAPALAPPLRRHVALKRAEEKWSAAVNAWRAGDNEPMPTEAEAADAHLDEVGELFIALIETPAPTVDAVLEKAVLARRTGYFRTEEFADVLSRDLAALPEQPAAPAVSRGSILFWLDLMRQGKTDHATEVMEAALGQLPETEEA